MHKAYAFGAALAISLPFTTLGAFAGPVTNGGSAGAGAAFALSADAPAAPIEKTQFRRRGGGPRVGVAPGRGFRGGGRRGLSTGAAVGLGVGAAALGILGAAAAANAAPPAVVYDDCYWTSRRVYDDWGNYVGRRRVQVCP